MLASILGANWLPAELDPKELDEAQPEGIWVYLQIERGILLRIE